MGVSERLCLALRMDELAGRWYEWKRSSNWFVSNVARRVLGLAVWGIVSLTGLVWILEVAVRRREGSTSDRGRGAGAKGGARSGATPPASPDDRAMLFEGDWLLVANAAVVMDGRTDSRGSRGVVTVPMERVAALRRANRIELDDSRCWNIEILQIDSDVETRQSSGTFLILGTPAIDALAGARVRAG